MEELRKEEGSEKHSSKFEAQHSTFSGAVQVDGKEMSMDNCSGSQAEICTGQACRSRDDLTWRKVEVVKKTCRLRNLSERAHACGGWQRVKTS